jgi:hypothetical protein
LNGGFGNGGGFSVLPEAVLAVVVAVVLVVESGLWLVVVVTAVVTAALSLKKVTQILGVHILERGIVYRGRQ